tara:strand:+ start:6082 stop:6846 length:765 start_codon:yes stop_codon:yes gene_type:complete
MDDKLTLLHIVEPIFMDGSLPMPYSVRALGPNDEHIGDYTPEFGDIFNVVQLEHPTTEEAANYLRKNLGDISVVFLPRYTFKDDESRDKGFEAVRLYDPALDELIAAREALGFRKDGVSREDVERLRKEVDRLLGVQLASLEKKADKQLHDVIVELSETDERIGKIPVFVYTSSQTSGYMSQYVRNGGFSVWNGNDHNCRGVVLPRVEEMLSTAVYEAPDNSETLYRFHHPSRELMKQRRRSIHTYDGSFFDRF